jgi:hypothetical protein
MKIQIVTTVSQVYLLPYVKITYNRWLNGNLEFIIGWLNKELTFSI